MALIPRQYRVNTARGGEVWGNNAGELDDVNDGDLIFCGNDAGELDGDNDGGLPLSGNNVGELDNDNDGGLTLSVNDAGELVDDNECGLTLSGNDAGELDADYDGGLTLSENDAGELDADNDGGLTLSGNDAGELNDDIDFEMSGLSNTSICIGDSFVDKLYDQVISENALMEVVTEVVSTLVDGVTNSASTTPQKSTRKRKRNQGRWTVEKRKHAHQAGKTYISKRGKLVLEKKIIDKKNCQSSCKFNCAANVDETTRENIFENFYKKNHDEKHVFIESTTEQTAVKRRSVKDKKTSKPTETKRKNSYVYYLKVNGEKRKVCQSFYTSTLAISKAMVYSVHANKNPETMEPKRDGRGRHGNQSKISEEKRQVVIDHINSFPRIESHYCRAKTSKEYLQSDLNIEKMYNLYVERCLKKKHEPTKQWFYSKVFNNEFNLDFHVPKSDRCDRCELRKNQEKEHIAVSDEELAEFETHILEKKAMREEKKKDKASGDKKMLVVFDLENVINLPKAEISSFFYKRKLNLYNLTAITTTKQGYCSIWTELTSGRKGNDIASAFIQLMEKVVNDNPNITNYVTWSDSCVPQNRNSVMSEAIIDFMRRHPHIDTVEMKFSVPGHSCVQEVDNMHSQIEKAMQVAEFYSPVSFLRVLLNINKRKSEGKPFCVIQMQNEQFMDYMSCSKHQRYSLIPFSHVAMLRFSNASYQIGYKTSFRHPSYTQVDVTGTTRGGGRYSCPTECVTATPKTAYKCRNLDREKKKDLKSMLKYCPLLDQEYYKSINIV